jgi:hypothetical protein
MGSRKCNADSSAAIFRIVNSLTGQDLVFGSSKIYDKNLIKFYSLSGTDTIFHHYGAGPNPNPGQDSLLFVNFDYRKQNVVFVRLTNSDIDTMYIVYDVMDASPCCPDFSMARPSTFNSKALEVQAGGIAILKK